MAPEAALVVPPEIRQSIHDVLKAGSGVEPQQLEQQLLAVFTKLTFSYSRRSPLPPPIELAEYDRVLPGSAERIFASSERQAAHRIAVEASTIAAQNTQSGRGQHYGFSIAVLCLILSFIAIMTGHEVSGSIIGSLDLVALVTVFVIGRQAQLSNLQDKAKAVPPSPQGK